MIHTCMKALSNVELPTGAENFKRLINSNKCLLKKASGLIEISKLNLVSKCKKLFKL
jgi:hypothetical protein